MIEFSNRMKNVSASAVREILKLMADPNIISFGGGSPAKEAFPLLAIKEITEEILNNNSYAALQYGISEGYVPLREAYLKHIAHPKGVVADVDNVLIVTGATQGINLAIDVLLNPGDVVLVESPTFLTTLMVLNKYEVKCIEVETDDQGMIIADLEDKIKKYNPKLLYSVPTFQNPTGKTLPLDRRKKLASLASENNMFVIEDDPYCDLRYKGEALPPIKHFDKTGHVIFINSFSKIISPGLRVGSVIAEKEIIDKMTISKQCSDTHTSNLSQIICCEFLNKGLLREHLNKINSLYRERMETMLDCIDLYFPKGTKYTKPEGGLFIWVQLGGNVDINELLKLASKECNVAFVPGSPFFVNSQDGNKSLRLNFSSNTPETIKIGMKKLGDAIHNNIRIELVTTNDYKEIYEFEKNNKDFFEKVLPPRPLGYENYDSFKKILDSLLLEQSCGDYYMYIIRNYENKIVARINLQMIIKDGIRKAEVGYRTDFEERGKGIISKAIKFILSEAFNKYDVIEVIAGTSKENIGSQRVLEKNGFIKTGDHKDVFKVNGKMLDGFLYSKQRISK